MIVSTFNIQNEGFKNDKNKAKEIYSYLINNKINILSLQEVYKSCEKNLLKLLNDKYNLYGKFRFLLKNPYNEKVPVITSYEILEQKTYKLPHFPSFTKRVMTKVIVKYKNQKIAIYNTHLEYKNDKVKTKQLDKIFEIIKKEQNPLILTGDFNLKTNNKILKKFIKKLEKKEIYLIENKEKTLKKSKGSKPIDHIFVSKSLNVTKIKTITDLEISDHYPVLVKLDI